MKTGAALGCIAVWVVACSGSSGRDPSALPEYEAVPEGPATGAPSSPSSTEAPLTAPAPTSSSTSAAPAVATASAAPTASASTAPDAKPSNALAVPDANLTVGSITADGFTMKDLACRLDGGGGLGGLLLGPTIAAGLSKKKTALDACAPKGADVHVRFTAAGGKITAAEAAAGDAKVEACVVKVLRGVPGIADGTCSATLHAGR